VKRSQTGLPVLRLLKTCAIRIGLATIRRGHKGLLEAEIVTADGAILTANACTNSDLFWALKGGGGGSWGVVTKVTLRTHDLPEFFGAAWGKVQARSDEAYRKLIAQFIRFYTERLFNPHWGEQVSLGPDNTLKLGMNC
jgi:FAD/FMN-containing dehydrogenase